MRSLAVCLLLMSGVTLSAPTLVAPASVSQGAKVHIQASGGAPKDFVSIVAKGEPAGRYTDYFYLESSTRELDAPAVPGDYEVRLLGAESPYPTLLSRPLKVVAVAASVKGPTSTPAGGEITVSWTGPNNERDYIAIGDTKPGSGPYLVYEYTKNGNPVTLKVPDTPGTYELRYFLGVGDQLVARQTLTVGTVNATLSAPAQVAAGAKFDVKWTGPNNARDFVTLVKAGAAERTYDRYDYTAKGPTLTLTAPDIGGNYELRYATGENYLTLARLPIVVTAIQGSLTGPASVVAGETFKVGWKGPANPGNYITIVAKGAKEGAYGEYAYTDKANPVSILAPLAPGDYELRYSTAESNLTLARAPIKVTPAQTEPGKVAVTLANPAAARGAVEIILDASGSMLQKLGAQRRIDIAKQTLTKLTSSTIPAGTPFALRVFGREVNSCQTDLDVPVAPLNPAAVKARIDALVAKNGAKTPIGASLEKAADDLKSVTGEKLIVLITDGEETCNGNPAAAIAQLRKGGVTTRVSIVGFALEDPALGATFRRWADAGGGAFFDAKDAAGLDKSLTEALRPGFEVVNVGGQVLASGIVGGDAVTVPAGSHNVRIKGRASAAKPVTVKPKETTAVAF